MAVTGITNLADPLSSQLPTQTQQTPKKASAFSTGNNTTGIAIQDTFTPTPQNNTPQSPAQAAGLFQIPPAPAATTPAISRAALNINQGPAPAPVAAVTTTNATVLQTAAVTTLAPPAAVTQVATAPAPQAATPRAAQAAANAAANAANQLAQIQALNNELATLGLSSTYFGQIDQIASLSQNFDPAAYTNLVYLDETLTPAAGAQTTANATAASAQNAAHAPVANPQTANQQTSRI